MASGRIYANPERKGRDHAGVRSIEYPRIEESSQWKWWSRPARIPSKSGSSTRTDSDNKLHANLEADMLSARNQFQGTIKSVKLGNIMAEVVVSVGNLEIVSVITRGSVERMGLKPGDTVTAVIKSTEVLVAKD